MEMLKVLILLPFICDHVKSFDKPSSSYSFKNGSYSIDTHKHLSHSEKGVNAVYKTKTTIFSKSHPQFLMSKLGVNVSSGYGEYSDSGCSLEMFGGDSNAYWACVTEYALQTNWFPSPIAGLFFQ